MSGFHPPIQQRAQATLDRFFLATVELLKDRPFERISVADIVEQANASVGAFYKRFSSKQALLPVLLDWLHRQQFRQIEAFVSDPAWQSASLSQRLDRLLDCLTQSYDEQHFLMKALVSRQYSNDNQLNREQSDNAEQTLLYFRDWLLACDAEIDHPQPKQAVTIALGVVVTQLQARMLFDAQSSDMPLPDFVAELKTLFLRYLGVEDVSA